MAFYLAFELPKAILHTIENYPDMYEYNDGWENPRPDRAVAAVEPRFAIWIICRKINFIKFLPIWLYGNYSYHSDRQIENFGYTNVIWEMLLIKKINTVAALKNISDISQFKKCQI